MLFIILGLISLNAGDYDRAIELFNRSLEINEIVFGPDNLNSEGATFSLAALYQRTKNFKDSGRTFEKALDLRTQIYGPEHFNVAITHWRYGVMLTESGDYSKCR